MAVVARARGVGGGGRKVFSRLHYWLAQWLRLPSVRVGEQSERMKLIPLFLLVGMLAVEGCSPRVTQIVKPETYSAELVKKAEAGDADAQFNLGDCYRLGTGVTQDSKEAFKWYAKSAEQGVAWAQSWLGYCYISGTGVTQDSQEAVKFYKKSAEQGNDQAQFFLGSCYANGTGVTQDYKEAVKWYTKSAEQGCPQAKEALEKLKSK